MPSYRFTLLAADGHADASFVLNADSDDAAAELASDLLLESPDHTVEAWLESRLVCRIARLP